MPAVTPGPSAPRPVTYHPWSMSRMDAPDAAHLDERTELWREATTMALYVAIVVLAAVVALPTDGHGEHTGGVHGLSLLGLVWGTTIGLALAHWFAFRLAARGFGAGEVGPQEVATGLAQVAGAAAVAALCSIPVLVFDRDHDVQFTAFVPALIGVAGYLVGRESGHTPLRSILVGAVALVLGVAIAVAKNVLAGH